MDTILIDVGNGFSLFYDPKWAKNNPVGLRLAIRSWPLRLGAIATSGMNGSPVERDPHRTPVHTWVTSSASIAGAGRAEEKTLI